MSYKSVSRSAFTKSNVEAAPDSKGVYYLYENGKCTYIGSSTVSRRSRLLSHYNGNEGSCTQNAGQFGSEWESDPKEAERRELRRFRNDYGVLPKCNDRIP